MILDSQEALSLAQAVTIVGDTPSTNVIDTGTAYDSSAGAGQYLLVRTVAGVTSGGAATVQIVLQSSADNGTFTDVMATAPFALAALTGGKLIALAPLPMGLRRYWRVVYRVATAALTGGTFSASVLNNVQAQQYMPSGFMVA